MCIPCAARSSKFDVKSINTNRSALLSDVLSGQHSGVRTGLIPIGLNFHTSGDASDCFPTREVSHVNESVVKGGIYMGDTEHILPLQSLRTQSEDRLFLLLLSFT